MDAELLLTMHPRAVKPAVAIHRGARHVEITTPPGAWHQASPPRLDHWIEVRRSIDKALQEVERADPDVVRVYALTPYALAAYLGNRLYAMKRAFILYQPVGDVWQPWGPHEAPAARELPVFGAPEELPGAPGTNDVAVTIEVTHMANEAEIQTALAQLDAQGAARVRLRVSAPGRSAIPDAAAAERAVRELDAVFESLPARHPGARFHLFAIGPQALLARAAERLHILSGPWIVYERIDGGAFVPVIEFPRARFLLPDEPTYDLFLAHAGPDKPAARRLYELLSPRYRVFLDEKSLLPGDRWDEVIPAALKASRVTVLLTSEQAQRGYYDKEELAMAIAESRRADHRVVPVCLDDHPPPYGIQRLNCLYAKTPEELDAAAERLAELVDRLVTKN